MCNGRVLTREAATMHPTPTAADLQAIATYVIGQGPYFNLIMDMEQLLNDALSGLPEDDPSSQVALLHYAMRLLRGNAEQQRDIAHFINEGTIPLVLRPCNVVDLIREVLATQRLYGPHIRFDLTFSEQDVVAYCDPDRLFQALYVLIDNAHQYTMERLPAGGGLATIAVTSTLQGLTITISDNGGGVDPEILPRLGDPGVRGHPHIPGAGWGLYYVRGVAAAHGGRVTWRNRTDVPGFEVSLTFPQQKDAIHAWQSTAAPHA